MVAFKLSVRFWSGSGGRGSVLLCVHDVGIYRFPLLLLERTYKEIDYED